MNKKAAVSSKAINAFFNNISKELHSLPHIWNYDETNLNDDSETKKVKCKQRRSQTI